MFDLSLYTHNMYMFSVHCPPFQHYFKIKILVMQKIDIYHSWSSVWLIHYFGNYLSLFNLRTLGAIILNDE